VVDWRFYGKGRHNKSNGYGLQAFSIAYSSGEFYNGKYSAPTELLGAFSGGRQSR
jgi:hypothetical protein